MHGVLPEFRERVARCRDIIDRLYADFDATVKATVADGWPEPMVRRGFALHRETWDVGSLVDALHKELAAFGGVSALDRFVEGRRIIAPRQVIHVWPALPGAGVTPMLYGWLLGASQSVRPSRRGRSFAQHFNEVCLDVLGAPWICIEEGPTQRWRDADVVVISGSDDTVRSVTEFLHEGGHLRRPVVTAFGHRVSFALVVDDGTSETMSWAEPLARDIVMWHQLGCFSARGVLFAGDTMRMSEFSRVLGAAIAEEEARQGAATIADDAALAQRVQARGVAECTAEVYGDGLGWVQVLSSPFRGEQVAPHVVTMHHVGAREKLSEVVALPPEHIQGVCLGMRERGATRSAWMDALVRLGATRICMPGRLQAPPADWLHDGRPNVTGWIRVCVQD
ncbi:MAG: acyl-CoA reductase [Myxococcota bacterium]